MKDDDPFLGTWEYNNGLLGREIWRMRTSRYVAAVRLNKQTGEFLLYAVGTFNGESYDACQTFKRIPDPDDVTKESLDRAFIRAFENDPPSSPILLN